MLVVISTYLLSVYSDMDKIILQDPKDYAPGHGDFGVVAQNIPSGYCTVKAELMALSF